MRTSTSASTLSRLVSRSISTNPVAASHASRATASHSPPSYGSSDYAAPASPARTPRRLVPPYVGPASASFPSTSVSSSFDARASRASVEDSFRRLTAGRRGFASFSRAVEQRARAEGSSSSSPTSPRRTARVAALAALLVSSLLSGEVLYADDDPAGKAGRYKREGPKLLVLLGSPRSGKTTQAQRLAKRFNLPLHSSSSSLQQGELYVYELPAASPSSIAKLKKEVSPIFCVLFFDLPVEAYRKRFPDDKEGAERLQRERDDVDKVVKAYRETGEILEISADWESADEVWEQVEAKVEQILELRERGEELGS